MLTVCATLTSLKVCRLGINFKIKPSTFTKSVHYGRGEECVQKIEYEKSQVAGSVSSKSNLFSLFPGAPEKIESKRCNLKLRYSRNETS